MWSGNMWNSWNQYPTPAEQNQSYYQAPFPHPQPILPAQDPSYFQPSYPLPAQDQSYFQPCYPHPQPNLTTYPQQYSEPPSDLSVLPASSSSTEANFVSVPPPSPNYVSISTGTGKEMKTFDDAAEIFINQCKMKSRSDRHTLPKSKRRRSYSPAGSAASLSNVSSVSLEDPPRSSPSRLTPNNRSYVTKEEALNCLWELHKKECHYYRQNPDEHPEYMRERKMWDDHMTNKGFDVYNPVVASEWEVFWEKTMDEYFDDSWKTKERNFFSSFKAPTMASKRGRERLSCTPSLSSDDENYDGRKKERIEDFNSYIPLKNLDEGLLSAMESRKRGITLLPRRRSSSSRHKDSPPRHGKSSRDGKHSLKGGMSSKFETKRQKLMKPMFEVKKERSIKSSKYEVKKERCSKYEVKKEGLSKSEVKKERSPKSEVKREKSVKSKKKEKSSKRADKKISKKEKKKLDRHMNTKPSSSQSKKRSSELDKTSSKEHDNLSSLKKYESRNANKHVSSKHSSRNLTKTDRESPVKSSRDERHSSPNDPSSVDKKLISENAPKLFAQLNMEMTGILPLMRETKHLSQEMIDIQALMRKTEMEMTQKSFVEDIEPKKVDLECETNVPVNDVFTEAERSLYSNPFSVIHDQQKVSPKKINSEYNNIFPVKIKNVVHDHNLGHNHDFSGNTENADNHLFSMKNENTENNHHIFPIKMENVEYDSITFPEIENDDVSCAVDPQDSEIDKDLHHSPFLDLIFVLKQMGNKFGNFSKPVSLLYDLLYKANEERKCLFDFITDDAEALLTIIKDKIEQFLNKDISIVQKAIYQETFNNLVSFLKEIEDRKKTVVEASVESISIEKIAKATEGKDCKTTVEFIKVILTSKKIAFDTEQLMNIYLKVKENQVSAIKPKSSNEIISSMMEMKNLTKSNSQDTDFHKLTKADQPSSSKSDHHSKSDKYSSKSNHCSSSKSDKCSSSRSDQRSSSKSNHHSKSDKYSSKSNHRSSSKSDKCSSSRSDQCSSSKLSDQSSSKTVKNSPKAIIDYVFSDMENVKKKLEGISTSDITVLYSNLKSLNTKQKMHLYTYLNQIRFANPRLCESLVWLMKNK